jgi:GTP-binding protein
LIAGAADGAGLGIQFLKHLARTRLLLHLIDACPQDGELEPEAQLATVETELARYSERLASQPRWLVLNKLDLLPESARAEHLKRLRRELGWQGPIYGVSALTGEGTERLAQDVMVFLERLRQEPAAARDALPR